MYKFYGADVGMPVPAVSLLIIKIFLYSIDTIKLFMSLMKGNIPTLMSYFTYIYIKQEVANSLAKLSVHALSRLCGYLLDDQATPENPTVRKSLAGMLTPYIARKLAVASATEVRTTAVSWACE